MFDQASYISFGVRDVHSEKSYHELRKLWFLVKPCVKMAQKIPAFFASVSFETTRKDVDFGLGML